MLQLEEVRFRNPADSEGSFEKRQSGAKNTDSHSSLSQLESMSMLINLQRLWERNGPDLQAAVTNGLPRFVLAASPRGIGDGIPVFSFHSIEIETLERNLDFLSDNRYVTIDADAMLDHLERRRRAPEGSVVLTFDDGSQNLYEVVFPLLKQRGMRAVAFIATAFHREKEDELASGLGSSHTLPLNWPQIREMHASGLIDFQSHTHEHRYLLRRHEILGLEGSSSGELPSLQSGVPELSIEEDFLRAKEIIENKLNKTVRHLAFPGYKGTREALSIGRRVGYEAFWWGVLPHRPDNRPGQDASYIVRLDGRYLRRLPGEGRETLVRILSKRYQTNRLRSLLLKLSSSSSAKAH